MTWPAESPAAPSAEAAPSANVTRSLDAHPPLPGEPVQGWAGLKPEAGAAGGAHAEHAAAVTYTCPMHADVVSDQPGRCPRCGMGLVERDAPK